MFIKRRRRRRRRKRSTGSEGIVPKN